MKYAMSSMLVLALTGVLGSCAMEPTSDPDEASHSDELSVSPRYAPGRNFVRSCNGLTLRTCDDPGSCASPTVLSWHSEVLSDFEDGAKHMAHLTQPAGFWAQTLSASGRILLASTDGPCN